MIISQIIGGLGNQMFQYAAGRALSLKKETKLALDISAFDASQMHQGFELNEVFIVSARIASREELKSVLGWQSPARIRQLVSRKPFSILRSKDLVAEPYFQYWPEINNVSNNCYLSGYWQSEKYFVKAGEQIRADFVFKSPLSGENAELSKKIKQVNSVSLHVRRGDYMNNQKTNATHGVCSLEYYKKAIQYVAERVAQPYFFIFSDDIEWVKENLIIDFPFVYVQHNRSKESYKDMQLMSMCCHHIIANSSFSWWGAWLNPGKGKIVVAPAKWFANQTSVRDLFPQGWVTL